MKKDTKTNKQKINNSLGKQYFLLAAMGHHSRLCVLGYHAGSKQGIPYRSRNIRVSIHAIHVHVVIYITYIIYIYAIDESKPPNSYLVLVITWLGEGFAINYPGAFLKILKNQSETRATSKLSKTTRVIYSKNCPNQTCRYWLITPNQKITLYWNWYM